MHTLQISWFTFIWFVLPKFITYKECKILIVVVKILVIIIKNCLMLRNYIFVISVIYYSDIEFMFIKIKDSLLSIFLCLYRF